jgi:DNA-binding response OmpR family regulator
MEEKQKKVILVVDDEADIRTVLRVLLTGEGFSVKTAANGEEALQILKREKFDLIILDLLMPRINGYQLISSLPPEVAEKMPVVMLTARTTDQDILKGYSIGAAYYITKPFESKTITKVVNYLIGDLSPEERATLESQLSGRSL